MSEIQSLARGLRIINLLANRSNAVSVTEVATQLEIDKSSASRLIKTLVNYGYAERDENTRRYRLGQAVRKLSAPQSSHALLQEIALPFLRQLVAKTGENAHLAVNIGDVALVIADIESTEALRVVSEVGRQERLYCTAVGKCLLAFGNGTIPDKLPRLTQHTITEQLQLENHLEKIRKQGYAIDDEEKTIGIRCLAAPVYDATEKAIASIGISGPASRLTMDKLYPLTEIIMQEASAFSGILGH